MFGLLGRTQSRKDKDKAAKSKAHKTSTEISGTAPVDGKPRSLQSSSSSSTAKGIFTNAIEQIKASILPNPSAPSTNDKLSRSKSEALPRRERDREDRTRRRHLTDGAKPKDRGGDGTIAKSTEKRRPRRQHRDREGDGVGSQERHHTRSRSRRPHRQHKSSSRNPSAAPTTDTNARSTTKYRTEGGSRPRRKRSHSRAGSSAIKPRKASESTTAGSAPPPRERRVRDPDKDKRKDRDKDRGTHKTRRKQEFDPEREERHRLRRLERERARTNGGKDRDKDGDPDREERRRIRRQIRQERAEQKEQAEAERVANTALSDPPLPAVPKPNPPDLNRALPATPAASIHNDSHLRYNFSTDALSDSSTSSSSEVSIDPPEATTDPNLELPDDELPDETVKYHKRNPSILRSRRNGIVPPRITITNIAKDSLTPIIYDCKSAVPPPLAFSGPKKKNTGLNIDMGEHKLSTTTAAGTKNGLRRPPMPVTVVILPFMENHRHLWTSQTHLNGGNQSSTESSWTSIDPSVRWMDPQEPSDHERARLQQAGLVRQIHISDEDTRDQLLNRIAQAFGGIGPHGHLKRWTSADLDDEIRSSSLPSIFQYPLIPLKCTTDTHVDGVLRFPNLEELNLQKENIFNGWYMRWTVMSLPESIQDEAIIYVTTREGMLQAQQKYRLKYWCRTSIAQDSVMSPDLEGSFINCYFGNDGADDEQEDEDEYDDETGSVDSDGTERAAGGDRFFSDEDPDGDEDYEYNEADYEDIVVTDTPTPTNNNPPVIYSPSIYSTDNTPLIKHPSNGFTGGYGLGLLPATAYDGSSNMI